MAITGNGVVAMDPLAEVLSSVPQIGRKRTAGDGTEPTADAQAPEGEEQQAPPSLSDASDQDAFRTIDQLARSQDRLRRNRWAIDCYHTWLDSNVQFGRLDKIPNQNIWVAKLPPGTTFERAAAVPNKAADLCNKTTDAMLADPPKPNPQPHKDNQSTDASAKLCAELLRQNGGETGINEVQQFRWGFRNALTRSTSFLEYDVDQTAGGYQAKQILASEQAVDPNDPLKLPTGGIDPNPILRFVNDAGQFVPDPSQAARVWLPKVIVRRHQRTKVITIPATANIEDAEIAVLTDWCTLAEGRKRWPDTVGQMAMDDLMGLTQWRPAYAEMIVPFPFRGGTTEGATGPDMDAVGSASPLLQRRMYFHRAFFAKCPDYPQGLILDVSGVKGGFRLGQATMDYQVEIPEGGTDTRCGDIRLVQITPIQDVIDQDPQGWPFEARFDGSAQADALLIAGYLDALDRMAHPHVFIPSTTAVDEDEWFDRSKPIVIGPTDKPPFYEQFPALPPIVQVSEYLQTRQDTSSGLTATAQGLDSSNSQSGVAKRLTVRQAQISLAGMQQQLHAAYTRGWRLEVQLMQQYYSIPQLIQFNGEESSDQEQWWTGQDLSGIDEIGIEVGTGTFMTAEDKANLARFLQDSQWMTPEQAGDIGTVGVARDLGLPADPVKAAIEREVAAWLKGPPEGWVEQYQVYQQQKQQYDQMMGQYQQAAQAYEQAAQATAVAQAGPPNPTTGPESQNQQAATSHQAAVISLQRNPLPPAPPQPPQIPQPVPPPGSPFSPRPNDNEPVVAAQWRKRLSHLMMTPRYSAQPPEWRSLVDDRYTAARQAEATAAGAGHPEVMQGKPRAQQGAKPAQLPSSTNGPVNTASVGQAA